MQKFFFDFFVLFVANILNTSISDARVWIYVDALK